MSDGNDWVNNMTMKPLELSALDTTFLAKLNTLIQKCDGYEPFYLCAVDADFSTASSERPAFMHYAAFSDSSCSQLTGFLSFVITRDHDQLEAEITALTAPEYRRRGICRELLSCADRYLNANGVTYRICQLPDDLLHSSINKGYAYSEYLMQLDSSNHHARADQPSVSLSVSNISSGCEPFEYYFSEDGCAYLMYRSESDEEKEEDCYEDYCYEEPIAVCSLDYQPSFTSLYGVYVEEELRGKGIGTLLLKNLLADYFEESDAPLILNVRSTNPAAVSLYRKCGFMERSCINYSYV